MFSVSLVAQKIEVIKLDQNIKDRRGLTKSLIFIDNRTDKVIGNVADKKETAEVKFENEDLKNHFENWFLNDNKKIGNTDLVIMLEGLKVYDEQDANKDYPYAKLKIKISSFLKRNDKYYFVSRYDNVIVCDPKDTSHPQKYLASVTSEIIAAFIRESYSNTIMGSYIPENEINNYDHFLGKNYKAFNDAKIKDGVYTNFKSFYNQEPNAEYSIGKNKKGEAVKLLNNGVQVSLSEMYCYVENGKAYRLTPVGFDEMHKDNKGFYIYSSRANLFTEANNRAVLIGAGAGGAVGAMIGSIIDSASNKNAGAINGIGAKTKQESNIYIDSLTGDYIFER